MRYQGMELFLKKSTRLNYDPREHAIDAYIIARKTKSPSEALQATKIFALSNFFVFTENLTHNEGLDSHEVRSMLKRKVLEFAGVLDFTEEQCEQNRNLKMKYGDCSTACYRPSKTLEQLINILSN